MWHHLPIAGLEFEHKGGTKLCSRERWVWWRGRMEQPWGQCWWASSQLHVGVTTAPVLVPTCWMRKAVLKQGENSQVRDCPLFCRLVYCFVGWAGMLCMLPWKEGSKEGWGLEQRVGTGIPHIAQDSSLRVGLGFFLLPTCWVLWVAV